VNKPKALHPDQQLRFASRAPDGSLVEGTVDLAFHEDTSDFVGWTIVDFKTDRELEAKYAKRA
jgi:hypothetical protein